MRYFEDGDQIVVVKDDFENLQENPAVFIDGDSPLAETIRQDCIIAIKVYQLREIARLLNHGGGKLETQFCW